ncbi:hypothetical protein Ade02nite_03480 [Paractinoplanes deccanensis]|uniref:Uncharacterized protein n=1 Tax=Paractinoplanes deccanensis TaxID=113561 RepID=A0ABQ3XVL1_9ACTN|nr:hypothetical protein Ade02nite_03480 [Actinoplanes deccanensis]
MPKGLSYADAVRILGGSGPLAKTVDNSDHLAALGRFDPTLRAKLARYS